MSFRVQTFRILVVLGLLFWAPIVLAGERIVDVDFEGLTTITENSVRSRILSIEGTELSRAQLGRDIKNLYRSGFFKDVEVKKYGIPGGVRLVFQLVENQVVGKLTVIGNKKIKDDDLEEALSIQEFETFDLSKVALSKKKILELYEEKGYFLADVETEVEPFDAGENQVEVIFRITEGRRVKIRRIKFIGNRAFSDKALRKKMRTKEKGAFSFVTSSGKLEDEKLEIDLKLLAFHYQDHGYLNAKVGKPSITLTRDKQSIYLTIPVTEGEQYSVGSVDLQGDIVTTKEEILSDLKLEEGEIYKKSLEYEDREILREIYGDQSYIFANIQAQIRTNAASKTADVVYYVRKGRKIKVDKIIIKGNEVTRDKVIRRELRIFENAFFSQSGLNRSRVRLMQLGYFDDVKFSTPRSTDPDKVNVVIEVSERSTGEVNIGGGFSTLESFILTARLRKENFLGYGWSTAFSMQLSKLQQNFDVYFRDWYFMDTDWSLTLRGYKYASALNPSFNTSRLGGSVGVGREVFDFFRTEFEYQYTDVTVSGFSLQVPQFFQEDASGVVSSVSTTFSYDRRDNRILPKKGVYAFSRFEYAGDFLGTDNPYFKAIGDNRFYIPLPGKLVFRGHQVIGYVNSLDSQPVRLANRFFMGGPNTLRGFELQAVGPNISVPRTAKGQDTTFSYGGDKYLQFNWELEVPIYADAGFYAVAFFDSGNAFGETENYSLTNLRHNYGFGVRWQSPIGPLRFEWGFPIGRRPGEDAAVFNFMIGPNF